jgi:hypothetical protein
MTVEQFDAKAFAQQELADAFVPAPEDFMAELGPLGAVWYLDQVGWAVLKHYTALLAADTGEAPPDGSEPVQAMAALSVAVGMLDGVCVTLGLIDAEAASRP